jgi:hypothetical protein
VFLSPVIHAQRHLFRALQRHVELHSTFVPQQPPFLYPQQASHRRPFRASQQSRLQTQ